MSREEVTAGLSRRFTCLSNYSLDKEERILHRNQVREDPRLLHFALLFQPWREARVQFESVIADPAVTPSRRDSADSRLKEAFRLVSFKSLL